MKKFTLSKLFTVVSTSLLGVSVLGTTIANNNVGAINTALGTTSYKIINHDDSGADTQYYKSKYSNLADVVKATDDLISEVEGEGAVLIKNDNNCLPLASGTKVSTFGVGSYRSTITSSGSVFSSGSTGREIDMKTGFEKAGLSVNSDIWNYYADAELQKTYTPKRNGMAVSGPLLETINEVPWDTVKSNTESKIGDYKVAIYNVVRISGEGNKDVNHYGTTDTYNGDALTLSNEERANLKGLKALKDEGKISKIIVMLNCTATVDLDFLNDAEYGVDAALQIQAVGSTGFNAIGKILTGEINPSGKSSDTLWYHNSQNQLIQQH